MCLCSSQKTRGGDDSIIWTQAQYLETKFTEIQLSIHSVPKTWPWQRQQESDSSEDTMNALWYTTVWFDFGAWFDSFMPHFKPNL